MTVEEGTPTEVKSESETGPAKGLSPSTGVESSEALEEKAFNANVDSLVPEATTNPLEDVAEETNDNAPEKEEAEAAAEAVAEAIKPFIGEMSEEDVLSALESIPNLEGAVFEKVSQKVFGKFGEIGQQLKALNEREFTFDPEKLTKLKEVDEGIAEALAEDLKGAFSGQQFDSEAVVSDLKTSIMADLNPYMEQRLLTALAPDAGEIVQTDDFNTWFFKEATQEVRDTFESWDKRERMDGVAMAGAFAQFGEWKGKAAKAAAVKQTTLKRSVEEKKGPSQVAPAQREMTEAEAFNARLKESA